MPIQNFPTIESQNKEDIKEMYGRYSPKNKNTMVIDSDTKIPYVCDGSGRLFYMKWGGLKNRLKKPHFFNRSEASKNKYIYTEEEVKFLVDNYPRHGTRYCSTKLDIPLLKIEAKVHRMGLIRDTDNIPEGRKRCCKCRNIREIKDFHKNSNSKDGLVKECKICRTERNKSRKLSGYGERRYYGLKGIIRNIKHRAKECGREFQLDFNWIDNNTKDYCPIFGIKFTFLEGNGYHINSSPSVDRIDNSIGYIPENCVVVSHRANSMKNNGNEDELYKLSVFYNNLRENKMEYMI